MKAQLLVAIGGLVGMGVMILKIDIPDENTKKMLWSLFFLSAGVVTLVVVFISFLAWLDRKSKNSLQETYYPLLGPDASESEIFHRVHEIICEDLGVDWTGVTMQSRFVEDFGVDDLDMAEFIMDIEDKFGLPDVSAEDDESFRTVGDVVRYIEEKLPSQGEPNGYV